MGHNYSLFLGFKGGSGVATGLGILVFLMPKVAGAVFLIWLALVLTTRYVSLGSIVAADFYSDYGLVFRLSVAVYRFRYNCWLPLLCYVIKKISGRLLSGTESKIKPGNAKRSAEIIIFLWTITYQTVTAMPVTIFFKCSAGIVLFVKV